MAEGKLSFNIGSFAFSAEGTESWLTEQLDKVLVRLEHLKIPTIPDPTPDSETSGNAGKSEIAQSTLVSFLQKTKAGTNQTKKFLASAVWIMAKQSKVAFTTKDVTQALTDAQQQKLGNASQCLANAVKAGYVEKGTGGTFYVTPEGKKELGLEGAA